MINCEVINAMMDLIDENIRLIEEIRSHGYESFSNGWKRLPKGEPIRQFDRITGLTGLKYKKIYPVNPVILSIGYF